MLHVSLYAEALCYIYEADIVMNGYLYKKTCYMNKIWEYIDYFICTTSIPRLRDQQKICKYSCIKKIQHLRKNKFLNNQQELRKLICSYIVMHGVHVPYDWKINHRKDNNSGDK